MSLRSLMRNWVIGTAGIVAATTLAPSPAGAGSFAPTAALPAATDPIPFPGMAGTDTALALTDSSVTVNGRGQFADLEITVNQTADLTNQAISVTWRGGVPTEVSQSSRFGSHFLQIMQCWGEDDGTVPGNPGPEPERCVWGGVGGVPGDASRNRPASGALGRTISRSDYANFDPSVGYVSPGGVSWRPFEAVGGAVVNEHIDLAFDPNRGGDYWLNPFFNSVTTNEIVGGYTYADGTGSEIVEMHTNLESSGLGCGALVYRPAPDAELTTPRCWLVIVPRGAAADEVAGTPSAIDPGATGVDTSPLAPLSWQNRIAVELDFTPIDSPCVLGSDEHRINGSELPLPAITRWQPVLCSSMGLPPFAYARVADQLARQQLTNPSPGAPGMVVVSNPVAPALADRSPIVYAPLTVSGIVIGAHVERRPRIGGLDDPMTPFEGLRVADLNFTPRLVAKLLTQSYAGQTSIRGVPPYEWARSNPLSLADDPDFLQFNPEFELLNVLNWRTFGGLQLPTGSSDAARQVWQWILADPEARAWLDGEPDEWGMVVNPIYSSDPTINPIGVGFGDPAPDMFPKSEPYCFQPQEPHITPPPLCGTDWMPYVRSFEDGARVARSGRILAPINPDPTQQDPNRYWRREGPQVPGSRAVLSLTDSPSAARFGLQIARLSRAGDDGADREFVGPDAAGLAAGVLAMSESEVPGVVVPASSNDVSGAYPLTAVTYAAIAPLGLDQQTRDDYAEFVEYAVGAGQTSGFQRGQLPVGYLPLLPAQREAALHAAETIRTLQPMPVATTTTTLPPESTPPTTLAPAPAPAPVAVPAPNVNQPSSRGPAPRDDAGPSTQTTLAPSTTVVATTVAESSGPTTTVDTAPSLPEGGGQPDPSTPAALTPTSDTGATRLAVPVLGSTALLSVLGALELTKATRRRVDGGTDRDGLGESDGGT